LRDRLAAADCMAGLSKWSNANPCCANPHLKIPNPAMRDKLAIEETDARGRPIVVTQANATVAHKVSLPKVS
jgi:hypothetical protein